MNALEQPTTTVTMEDLSREVLDCAKEGDVEGLTSLVARMKSIGARNVYVVAVEKQVAKLSAPDTTPEHRTELLKAFPVLIERAVAEGHRMASAPARPDPNEERREAMEKMKRQYFERADSFVDRGEFQRALEEVRRVLILDKTNALALEYEQKITHLIDAAAPVVRAPELPPQTSEATPAASERRPAGRMRLLAVAVVFLLIAISAVAFFVLRGHASTTTENSASIGQVTGTIAAQPAATDNVSAAQATPVASSPVPQATAHTEQSAAPSTPAPKSSAPEQPKQSTTTAATAAPSTTTPAGATTAGTAGIAAVAQPPTAPAQELPPPPTPFVATQTGVEVVRIPPLHYPEVAMRNHVEGRVVVQVSVDADGKPVETKILRSDNELLDDAAIEAAMNASFKPATMNENPVASKVSIPFNFRLQH